MSGVVEGKAKPRGRYAHIKRAGDFLFVSGTSARQPDNSIAGAAVDAMGTTSLDVVAQTRATLENIRDILKSQGATLADVVRPCQNGRPTRTDHGRIPSAPSITASSRCASAFASSRANSEIASPWWM